MSETLTDEQILGIDGSPSSEVSGETSEAPESAAPIEQEQTGEETQFEQPEAQVQGKPQTDKAQQQPGKPQDKTQQSRPTDPAQEAASYAELFPKGIEQAREAHAKAAQLGHEEQALYSGDTSQIGEVIHGIFGENPPALVDAQWVGFKYLEQYAPEQASNFARMVTADQLGPQGISLWSDLEEAYASAQEAGDQKTLAILDRIAGKAQGQLGLGPRTAETQATEWQSYEKHVHKSAYDEILHAFGPRLSTVQPAMQKELLTAAVVEIGDLLSKDAKMEAALGRLSKKYSIKAGVDLYYDSIRPRLRTLASLVVQNLANKYSDVFKNYRLQTRPRPAQRPAQQTPAKPKSMAEYHAEKTPLHGIMAEVLGESVESNPLYAGSDEVNRMGDLDILNSNQAGRPRPKTRPENSYFDEAGA